jgi:hypothetical protein
MSLVTLLGKYRGPSGLIRVFQEDGRTKAEYKGKGGGRAGFEGVLLEGGKSLKGFWYNYDEDVTPANRFECTCVVALEGAHGETMKLVGKKKGGGEESWEAKRWSERDVPRADGKITSFAFKDKAIFDRVSDNGFAKKQAWVETAREKMMEESVPRPNFDGSSSYIPPPAVGSEYMTQHEVDRLLKKKDEEHRLEVMANLEKRIEKLAAAGDDAKAKLETAKKLLKGEKQWDTLNERKPWCNGAGPFLPQSSKWPEHLPDEYRTEMEVMRALNKEELKQPERDKEKLEKEIPALEAKIAAGTGDVDMMKRRLEVARKLLKGVAGLGKLAERPDFKPPNVKVETAGRCVVCPPCPFWRARAHCRTRLTPPPSPPLPPSASPRSTCPTSTYPCTTSRGSSPRTQRPRTKRPSQSCKRLWRRWRRRPRRALSTTWASANWRRGKSCSRAQRARRSCRSGKSSSSARATPPVSGSPQASCFTRRACARR